MLFPRYWKLWTASNILFPIRKSPAFLLCSWVDVTIYLAFFSMKLALCHTKTRLRSLITLIELDKDHYLWLFNDGISVEESFRGIISGTITDLGKTTITPLRIINVPGDIQDTHLPNTRKKQQFTLSHSTCRIQIVTAVNLRSCSIFRYVTSATHKQASRFQYFVSKHTKSTLLH